jgi:rsbT antagonist protein RsbS
VDRIPILRMGEFLLVTIQVDMHDRLALTLQDDLTSRIAECNARGVLIDISALEIVDSFIGRMISNISGMARILDAKTSSSACSRPWPSRSWNWACLCQACRRR